MEEMNNRPCLDEGKLKKMMLQYCKENGTPYNKFEEMFKECEIGWFSRSMAVAVFIFCKDKKGEWYVLGSERGNGTPDFNGYWNCVCGYVEFNTTIAENCIKEVHEEVGIDIQEDDLKFIEIEDSPTTNKQNVTFRYAVVYKDRTIEEFSFTHKWNEKDEVGEIKWIKVKELDNYKWAFGHELRIKEIFNDYVESHHWFDNFLKKLRIFINKKNCKNLDI